MRNVLLHDKIAFGAALVWVVVCMSYILQPVRLPDFRNEEGDEPAPAPEPTPTPAPGPTPAPTPAPTPSPEKQERKRLQKALQKELITDSLLLSQKLGQIQGLYVFTPLPLIVIFAAITGCIKAPFAKTTNVIHRRMCPFLLFMLTGSVWAKRTLVREIEDSFVVFDKEVLPETVRNITQSFLSDVLTNLVSLTKGDVMYWNLDYRNLLDTPLDLQTAQANISFHTTEEIHVFEVELLESVQVPASSVQEEPVTLPLRMVLDKEGFLVTLGLASVVALRDGLFKISCDANLTTRINNRGLDVTIRVNFPLDLKVFGDIFDFGGGFTGGIINPNFTAPTAVMQSIVNGFQKMHQEDPPNYLVDPESITASGYLVYFAFGVIGGIYVLFGSVSQIMSFLFLRNCYEVGITVDDPIVLDADGAEGIEIQSYNELRHQKSSFYEKTEQS